MRIHGFIILLLLVGWISVSTATAADQAVAVPTVDRIDAGEARATALGVQFSNMGEMILAGVVFAFLVLTLIRNARLRREINWRKSVEAALKKSREDFERKVRQAIRESESRYKSLFENNHAVMILIDPESCEIVDANPAAERFYGYGPDVLRTMKFSEISVSPKEAVVAEMKAAISESERYFINRHRLSDGGVRSVEVYSGPIELGERRLIYAIVHDISQRMAAERDLKESEKRFRTLTSLAPAGIFMTDAAGDYLYVNPHWARMAGMSPEAAAGRGWMNAVHPEDRQRVIDYWYNTISNLKLFEMEYRFLKPDSQITLVSASVTTLYAEDGSVSGFMGTVTDITALRKATDALLESEERYRQLFENGSDAVVVMDAETHRLEDANPSALRLFGYEREAFVRLRAEDISAEHDKSARIIEPYAGGGCDQRRVPYRQFRKSDGSAFSGEVYSGRFESRGRVKVIGTIRDITERKHLEAQLRQAYKMEAIGTLAGGIAHDFNNILSAVIGYTELSIDMAEGDVQLQKNMEQVLHAGTRARELVRQILAFSRQDEQEFKPLQVKLIIKEAMKLLRASIPSNIDIRTEIESDAMIHGDATQIHQVLMNICTNAVHAMQDINGVLEVSLKETVVDEELVAKHAQLRPGLYLRLSISDTGVGMRPDTMERIFDPFFTTKKKGEGTGMGLSVVHGIVQSHGGAITVYSQLGLGTTFNLFLPILEDVANAATVEPKLPLPVGSESILFVDDEKPLADMAEQLIRSLGYRVVTRTSSVEALQLFGAEPSRFDLVITDMTMPNMTGDELAREIRRIRGDIPIILCTGFSARLDAGKLHGLDIRRVVNKPILKRDMAVAIRNALDNSG